jgi:hypothetical protein
LSSDELQFIAEYLGACILECADIGGCHAGLAERFSRTPRVAADFELKMILLREYLCRAGVRSLPAGVSAYQ